MGTHQGRRPKPGVFGTRPARAGRHRAICRELLSALRPAMAQVGNTSRDRVRLAAVRAAEPPLEYLAVPKTVRLDDEPELGSTTRTRQEIRKQDVHVSEHELFRVLRPLVRGLP